MPYLPKLHTPIYHNSFNIQGAGGEGPKPQTSTKPLTGLVTCALSLTLSPGGRGKYRGGYLTPHSAWRRTPPSSTPPPAHRQNPPESRSRHSLPNRQCHSAFSIACQAL